MILLIFGFGMDEKSEFLSDVFQVCRSHVLVSVVLQFVRYWWNAILVKGKGYWLDPHPIPALTLPKMHPNTPHPYCTLPNTPTPPLKPSLNTKSCLASKTHPTPPVTPSTHHTALQSPPHTIPHSFTHLTPYNTSYLAPHISHLT